MPDPTQAQSTVSAPQVPPQPTAPVSSSDPAEQILRSVQGVDSNAQADAWDAFHQSKNEDELSQRLQRINIPQDVKANLWDAKRSLAPVQPPKQAEPGLWDKTKHAIGQIFSATPEGAGSATSGAAAPELATQFKKDAEASEGPENKLTGAGVIVGGAKSAMEVPQTIGHFIAPNTFSAHPEALETKGTAETAGKIGENVLEFMAGDAALKNLNLGARFAKLGKIATLLDEHPVLAKAVEIGGNALRQGTVGAGQTLAHGGTAGEALTSAVVVGGTGAIFETAGQGVKALKNFVTRNPQVEQMGRELVSGLTEGATPEQVAQTVGKNLADAEEKMRSTYDAGIKKISAQGQNVPVPIAGSPLQQTAKDLLSDSKVPGS